MDKKNSAYNDETKSEKLIKNSGLNDLKYFTKEQIISTIKNVIDKNDSFKNEIFCLIEKNKDNFKKINEDEKNYSEYNVLWEEAKDIRFICYCFGFFY
jgi:TRAP-type mannitol/chloroaromatic compound transport system substrate-binding protein